MDIETLKILDKINLNNQISQLEHNLNQQEKQYHNLYIKSKEKLSELTKNNDILMGEISVMHTQIDNLKSENIQLHNIINRIPKFILKFLFKKNKMLLLDKGLNYEKKSD